jgi:hypothetical protein
MPNKISARLIFTFCRFYKITNKTTKHIHLHPKLYLGIPCVHKKFKIFLWERELLSREQYFPTIGLRFSKQGV